MCARAKKAWCGLKQAGKIAHDDLVKRLKAHGHEKVTTTEGHFRHETQDIDFALVVDDFPIQCKQGSDLDHLRAAMEEHCTFKADTDAEQCAGIHLKWDHMRQTVCSSMDGHIEQALRD